MEETNLIHESKRVKAFLISTWRSGSTITLALLASHPHSFAIDEPLINFGLERLTLKTDRQYDTQVQLVKERMNCNLTNTSNLFNFQ